ncbi:MAG: hypothetical protein WBD22_12665 [Pyrinomonadaceae bacterium]
MTLRYLIPSILIVFFGCTPAIVAQNPPPIATGVSNTRKTWESADGSFKIDFAAPPTTSVRPTVTSFGPASIHSANLSTLVGHYSVVYLDFPTAITDKYDLDTRFDLMRDEQAKQLSARVMLDSEFMFGTYYGRANVFETAMETETMRTFIAGPRLFMFLVVTKGRLSVAKSATAAALKKRINGFFDSFEIMKVPEASSQQVKLPDDFHVTSTNAVFSSAFLGVSLTPPAGWIASAKDESELLMELGKEEIKRTDGRLANYISNENTRVLAMYTSSELSKSLPDAFFFVFAEQTPYPNFTPAAAAATYEKIYMDRTEKVTKPITTVQFGGREFAWLETFDSELKLYQRIYFANVKGIAFEISMLYSKPLDREIMLKTLATIKFSQ